MWWMNENQQETKRVELVFHTNQGDDNKWRQARWVTSSSHETRKIMHNARHLCHYDMWGRVCWWAMGVAVVPDMFAVLCCCLCLLLSRNEIYEDDRHHVAGGHASKLASTAPQNLGAKATLASAPSFSTSRLRDVGRAAGATKVHNYSVWRGEQLHVQW